MMTRPSLCSSRFLITVATFATTLVHALKYDASQTAFNLNTNKTATSPLDYWGARDSSHQYHTSPDTWRVPFYTIFTDHFVNGDPSNDNKNGTLFETDFMSTQLRFGGDIQGVVDTLDYIAGMGIKAIYLAGSPFINQPWGADQYSPLDLTLLDFHLGNITMWQTAIDEIHARGMYVILDNTMATLGDLIGFEGYLNTSTPFSTSEHKVQWKSARQYLDFHFNNTYNDTCDYPAFWYEDGTRIYPDLTGCYNSDFDQYGDVEAFGVFPDWERQLSKFASVQDRLRDWDASVRARLERFSCMAIATLDIDGYRIDKAVQVTVDAQAAWSKAMRDCAAQYNKTNFLVVGEITSGNYLGSIYLGRGRTPNVTDSLTTTTAMTLGVNSSSDSQYFVREYGSNALDGGAFHYSVYRFMERFLGMSGSLEAGYDLPTDWVEMWNQMILTNDFYNTNTGKFDPRHLYGVANQDVFRWPAISQGTERMLLGYFITSLLLPGAPLVYYGEEQDLYILDNTASNYVFGRQAFAPSPAWMNHGCYAIGNDILDYWPVERALTGCQDASQGLDHRDPSAPIRNIFKRMFALRDSLPVLQNGWLLQQLAKKTSETTLVGSSKATEFGVWSVVRGWYSAVQTNETSTNVWLVYHNQNVSTTYTFDCSNSSDAFISPFDATTPIRNLFSTDAAITLEASTTENGFTSTGYAGCFSTLTLEPFEFRAYVPATDYPDVAPMITKFSPGHDTSIDTTNGNTDQGISLRFSTAMSCTDIDSKISAVLTSTASSSTNLTFTTGVCSNITDDDALSYIGYIPSVFEWNATMQGLSDGIVKITLANATTADGTSYTNSIDHFLLRFGKLDNPVVFPGIANYSRALLQTDSSGNMYINHSAPGATAWRYSTNWGSSWTDWYQYSPKPEYSIITQQTWSGTTLQAWEGKHVIVNYYSQPLGSSVFMQHSDSSDIAYTREQPHVHLHGPFNKWGYDAGLPGSMDLVADHTWQLHFMGEWPTDFQLNIWGMNPDNEPDQSFIYGDIDNDGVVDRLAPSSLSSNVVNITESPPLPYLSWKLTFNDATWRFSKEPQGNIGTQIVIFFLMWFVPLLTALGAGWVYVGSFYQVKVNKSGFKNKGWLPLKLANLSKLNIGGHGEKGGVEMSAITPPPSTGMVSAYTGGLDPSKKTVLIATMEYNMDDFKIKIKIGGLGVMAQLMANALTHYNLVWVVPMVGDIEYPTDKWVPAESMYVDVMGAPYEILVYHYQTKNITFVILDAPIFKKQTKADPYIARMDDIESAILYAAWNYSIAETIRRFPVDIYHINDYHGAAAPLYLLPQTIPVCLSLHNAEFQGMWPMRTPEESKEVCEVFNLPPEVVKDYVQYGSVFNLLHAGASYLRIHQRGFGAVGVSRKYGDRSLARYPIFWSLKNIGQLPNPDPSDTADWDPNQDPLTVAKSQGVEVDQDMEAKRADLRRQAQEWAGLEVDPTAELFVFVGRWSLQKGVDLIADIFPSVLEKYPKVQLICIGPVIDLYGRFAALKLEKLMQLYPKRVFSKPEFTQLPPYIFSGAEFALIPSRDEPFGLVAVEFGRKGALGVGARVGGLGQMPGFWFTVESMSPDHLLRQFRQAIVSALECKQEKRAVMRAWSAKQRFPVAQWVKQIDELYAKAIKVHNKEAKKKKLEVVSGSNLNVTRPSSRGSTVTYVDTYGAQAASAGITGDSPAGLSPLASPRPIASPMSGRPHSPNLPFSPGLPTPGMPWAGGNRDSIASSIGSFNPGNRGSTVSVDSFAMRQQGTGPGLMSPDAFKLPQHGLDPFTLGVPQPTYSAGAGGGLGMHRNSSLLSLPDVVGDRHDLKLQQVDQFFNDTSGEFYAQFDEMLADLNAKNSISDFCIETFLKKSEKEWFARYRDAKLGRHRDSSRNRSSSRPQSRNGEGRNESVVSRGRQRYRSRTPSGLRSEFESDSPTMGSGGTVDDEFLLGEGYQAPKGLKKYMSIRVGDWPIYSFFLAAQQIISINSYQLVLITGETSQTPQKLYIVSGSYLAMSVIWWVMSRTLPSVYSISAAWFFFGLGFILLGIAPLMSYWVTEDAMQDVATAMYAAGASSGALAFALNFGDEGGSPTRQWITRALIVSGFQQVYSLALWYWGSLVSDQEAMVTGYIGSSTIPLALVICIPIGIFMWVLGGILFVGLPDFYRQSPVRIPGFYISLYRRNIVPWFFVMIIIQNYWLSAPYGRSWQFYFNTQYIPGWGCFLLALGFFVGLWTVILYFFGKFSDEHTWLLPIFAIGLCAPRWAQELWGTSGLGTYLPWMSSGVASALLSRCLWLWLGLLDNIQGVGLGMMLLATLTRQHVLAVLIGAQVIGSAFTMLARATAPNALSPNTTFPDFSQGIMPGIASKWFWICLLFQLIIPIGFFKFFRKEQVSKP